MTNHFLPKELSITDFVEEARNMNEMFSVRFIKKGDGEVRDMVCRTGVKKGVTGAIAPGVRRDEDERNSVLTVFDMNVVERTGSTKGAFRRINLAQLVSCRLRGIDFSWDSSRNVLVQEGG